MFLYSGEDGEDCAVFEYSAGSNADFNEFTQMAFVIGNGDRDVYIDGVALTSEDSSYTGEFAIPASSDFNTYGSMYAHERSIHIASTWL